MSALIYTTWKAKDGNDWSAGADSAYKAMLVTSGYTPDAAHLHPNATGLASSEITGGSYARQNVASRAKAQNDVTGKYEHSANNVTFTGLVSATPAWLVVYRVVTGDADHQLVCVEPVVGFSGFSGDLTLAFSGGGSSGILYTFA